MSTLRVSSINNAAASAGGIAIDSSGGVTGALPAPNRNLLYNGAMQVAQRGTSTASITSGGYFTADRWYFNPVTMGTWTQSVESDAPTGSGLRKSLKVLATTADGSPAAGDVVYAEQQLEGQDCQRIAKGTSAAQQLTLSFWVKANVTGTYIAMLYDNDNTRHVSASYTVSASATWEKKTITFPADATGALDNDNASSLWVRFWLGVGTNHSSGTLATSWASYTAANAAVGQTNLAAATNNYWQITGVQLEVGPVATGFEFKSYGQELRECQRYYYRYTPDATSEVFGSGYSASTTISYGILNFPCVMRVAPSALEQSGTASHYRVLNYSANINCSAVPVFESASRTSAFIYLTVASGLTQGQAIVFRPNSTSGYLGFSAEL